ncbi:MAG: MDR family oxidoreductase [Microbacteriaceae bacterium]
MFKALSVDKIDETLVPSIVELSDQDLMDGEVLVEVDYSGINYKDAMAIFGTRPVLGRFPLIPGIDFVGTVVESSDTEFTPGTRVILNGWGVGETHHGGFAGRARVPAKWLIPLPAGLSAKAAGIFGTAGYTSALSFLALSKNVSPDAGKIIVTGANGGVGGLVCLILSREGYRVTAATSRPERADYLRSLGAEEVISLDELNASSKPMQHPIWAGGVDAIGGKALASILAQTEYNGTVTACGLAENTDLPTTVLPFILRSISLIGINSVFQPRELREEAWAVLAKHAAIAESIEYHEIGLNQIVEASAKVIQGGATGRYLVNPKL